MSVVDHYGPCPCGSGKKYKWCCQKAEVFIRRVEIMRENGQQRSEMAVVEEGLKKFPDVPWLRIHKASLLVEEQGLEEARAILQTLLDRQHDHMGAYELLLRVVLESSSLENAVDVLQDALERMPDDQRRLGAAMAHSLFVGLVERGEYLQALRYGELFLEFSPGDRRMIDRMIKPIQTSTSLSPVIKNPYRLMSAPEGSPAAQEYQAGHDLAARGQFRRAAATYRAILDHAAAPEALHNLALCQLWLLDSRNAAASLAQLVTVWGRTPGKELLAIEAESLRLECTDPAPEFMVEQVELTWKIRDRAKLLATLQSDPCISTVSRPAIDPEKGDGETNIDEFELLDRARIIASDLPRLNAAQIPRVIAGIVVTPTTVTLEALEDGTLDDIRDRFTAMVGTAIPPAQPSTKVVGKFDRNARAVVARWQLPEDSARAEIDRLRQEQIRIIHLEIWPTNPVSELGGKTPEQLARESGSRLGLRALLTNMASSSSTPWFDEIVAELRQRLGVPAETLPDVRSLDPRSLSLLWFHLVPVAELDDEQLWKFSLRSAEYGLDALISDSCNEIVKRSGLLERQQVASWTFGHLATRAAAEGDKDQALEWVEQGRGYVHSTQEAADWDMLEIHVLSMTSEPREWVPKLAVALTTYQHDAEANLVVISALAEMGLVRLVPVQEGGQVRLMLDQRALAKLLTMFGPRIQTASGELGVAASKQQIWTPGSSVPPTGSTTKSGIWTPGSAPPEATPVKAESTADDARTAATAPPSKIIFPG